MDGALTMQILKRLSRRRPVLFADVRHYHADLDVWDLCNSGQHATWFAARSDDPAENMRHGPPPPGGLLLPGRRRLGPPPRRARRRSRSRGSPRLDGRYRMHVLRGAFERFDDETNERADARVDVRVAARLRAASRPTPDEFLGRYGSNHIHAVPGDHVDALRERLPACSTSTSTASAPAR